MAPQGVGSGINICRGMNSAGVIFDIIFYSTPTDILKPLDEGQFGFINPFGVINITGRIRQGYHFGPQFDQLFRGVLGHIA